MDNFWEGEKIRLRAVEPSDVQHFTRWNLDSQRARNYDFVWPPQSQASLQAWVEEQSRNKLENDRFVWIIENNKGQAIGSIQTHTCNPRYGTFSYGIDIAREHQRRGYASEAIRMVLRYYFDELRYQKVTVWIYCDNEASVKLHEKLGFQREGTHRRMFYSGGQYIDELWFGLTVEEFHHLNP